LKFNKIQDNQKYHEVSTTSKMWTRARL